MMDHWDHTLATPLGRLLGTGPGLYAEAVGSGHGCRHFRLRTQRRVWFAKSAPVASTAILEAEADGLAALSIDDGPRVPAVHGLVRGERDALLVMEYLELAPPPAAGWRRMGEALAAVHRIEGHAFGWHRDNFLGATVQPNTRCQDWAQFWSRCRLGHQLDLAERDGAGTLAALGRQLQERLPGLLAHRPPAALLHGDLWAGNAGFTRDGMPAILDPAVHRGDPEAELAMTSLFGGFPPVFYQAYHACHPARNGHRLRRELYALYHVLNHAHLFGGGYRADAERRIRRLLART